MGSLPELTNQHRTNMSRLQPIMSMASRSNKGVTIEASLAAIDSLVNEVSSNKRTGFQANQDSSSSVFRTGDKYYSTQASTETTINAGLAALENLVSEVTFQR